MNEPRASSPLISRADGSTGEPLPWAGRTVAIVVDTVTSHVLATIGLAKRLAAYGYRVEYWGGRPIDPLVSRQGFPFRALDGLVSWHDEDLRVPPNAKGWRAIWHPAVAANALTARRRRRRTLADELTRFERSLDSAWRNGAPAFVLVHPFLRAYCPYFAQRGAPAVVLSATARTVTPYTTPPAFSSLVPAGGRLARWAIRASWLGLRLATVRTRALSGVARLIGLYTYDDVIRQAAARTGRDGGAAIFTRWLASDGHLKRIPTWGLWTAALDFPTALSRLDNLRYVGMWVEMERTEGPLPVEPDRRARLIYVAVGTVRRWWNDNVAFLLRVLDAFRNLPDVVVIVATGDERTTAALSARAASNIHVFDFVPQLEMLRITDVFITHGGSGSVREALARAVPMLVYPRSHDQIGNAARVVFHRLGLRGDRRRDTAPAIRDKALRILAEPAFRDNVRRLKERAEREQEQLLEDAIRALPDVARRTS